MRNIKSIRLVLALLLAASTGAAQAAPFGVQTTRGASAAQLRRWQAQAAREEAAARKQADKERRQQQKNDKAAEKANDKAVKKDETQMLDRLVKTLGLSKDQKPQVKTLLDGAEQQYQSLGRNTSLSDKQKQTQWQTAQDGMWKQIETLLTPAQKAKLDEVRQEEQLKTLSKQLGLSGKQQADIKGLLIEEAAEDRAVREDTSLSEQEQTAKLADLRSETWNKVDPLLTDQQRDEMDTMRETETLQGMTAALKLSRAQQAKIKPLLDDQAQQQRAARRDKELSPEARSAKIREVADTTAAAIDAVLTSAQRKKLAEIEVDDELRSLSGKLNLTHLQQTQVKPLLDKKIEQIQAVRDDTGQAAADRGAKLKEIRATMWTDLKPLLETGQEKLLAELRAAQDSTAVDKAAVTEPESKKPQPPAGEDAPP